MRKILSVLILAAVLMLTACGPEAKKEINVIKNEESVKPVQLSVPRELEGHMYVELMSFDGEYAVFRIDRAAFNENERETAEIVVYNVKSEKTVQYINLNLKKGLVTDAVKQGDWLYYVTYYPDENKYNLYANNGLKSEIIYINETETVNNGGIYFIDTEDSLLIGTDRIDENSRLYSFMKLENALLEEIQTYDTDTDMKITAVDYDRENNVLTLWTDNIVTDNTIEVNRWTGGEKEKLFSTPVVQSRFLKIMGDYIFHYSENSQNGANYRMLTATNIKENISADIDFVNMHCFVSDNDAYGIYKYDTPNIYITQVEINGLNITLTPVELDYSDVTRGNIVTAGDSCLVKVQRNDSPEVELYILEK